ncbi:MAG: hypothetical protein ACXWMK_09825 [Syntrophales bacterium]
MARVRKRGDSYQIDYFDPTGKRVRKSFAKKKNAEAELASMSRLLQKGVISMLRRNIKQPLGN